MAKKSKGFGQSPTPTRDAKDLLRAFKAHVSQGNQEQINQFFKANQARLDESLLEALPLVFATWVANSVPDERKDIARLFETFATAIQQFPLSNRMLNLELSIICHQLALKVLTHEAFSESWASIQNNLGLAYQERIRGDRAENLEQAIAASELALQVYTREAFPENWAMTQNNLGIAYRERIRGDRAENIEQAIAASELALQVRTREAFPKSWAMTQGNLGIAYRERIRGDRTENLEQAISASELALQVCTREAFPENWARVQHNLANAYCDRIRGEQIENLERAIAIYQQVAQVFTREAFPHKWAENQGHLAEALMKRSSLTNNAAELDAAIALLQDALEISVPGSPDFIDSQYRLGNALSRRYEHSQRSSDLEQSLQAYTLALEAISPEHYDRKQIWQALPTTQAILGNRLVREGQWQEGLQLLLNSVRQLSTGDDPLAHANALFQTGRAHETLSDWDNARLYYRDALRLYDHLQNQPGIAKSHAGLGSVLVSQGHLEKGMAELAKAREHYHQLHQSDKASDVENLFQVAQRTMERQAIEVPV
jgi:tetratricopeptide (TPR) repeat protein